MAFDLRTGSNQVEIGTAHGADVQPPRASAPEGPRSGTHGVVEIEAVNQEGGAIHEERMKNPPDRNPEGASEPAGPAGDDWTQGTFGMAAGQS